MHPTIDGIRAKSEYSAAPFQLFRLRIIPDFPLLAFVLGVPELRILAPVFSDLTRFH
jgi:hypothetical protein